MKGRPHRFVLFAVVAIGLLAAAGAQAQYYGAAPQQPRLYPYPIRSDQPYAVEVAPNTYVIHRPARSHRYVDRNIGTVADPNAPALDHRHKKAKRAPVEHTVINTKKIVHHAPLVVETQRVVDDPPRVVERRHVVEDTPVPALRKPAAIEDIKKRGGRDDNRKRVIHADAEITILGPDRMSIRLFRKGRGGNANAKSLQE